MNDHDLDVNGHKKNNSTFSDSLPFSLWCVAACTLLAVFLVVLVSIIEEHFPNGHLTTLSYGLIVALDIMLFPLFLILLPQELMSLKRPGLRWPIVLCISCAASYAALRNYFMFYTYFYGTPSQSSPRYVVKIDSDKRCYSQFKSCRVNGDYLYFKQNTLYSTKINSPFDFFLSRSDANQSIVTKLKGARIDTSKPITVYYKSSPFSTIITDFKSSSPATTKISQTKYPTVFFSIFKFNSYPFDFSF